MELAEVVRVLWQKGMIDYDGLRRAADRYHLESVLARAAELVAEGRDAGKTTEEQIGAVLAWAGDNECQVGGINKEFTKASPEAVAVIAAQYAKAVAVEIEEEEQAEKARIEAERVAEAERLKELEGKEG